GYPSVVGAGCGTPAPALASGPTLARAGRGVEMAVRALSLTSDESPADLPRPVTASGRRMHEPAGEDADDRPREREERDHDDDRDDEPGRVVPAEAASPPARPDAEDDERVADRDGGEDPPTPDQRADREPDRTNQAENGTRAR